METDQRFWAFISYSHRDAKWAEWLQRALESYRIPQRLVGRETGAGPAPRRFKPIFRDREDLAADPDLRVSVRRALERCGFLIVVCSPEAARSPWVQDEIVQFKRLHGEARILSVIVRGEPNASAMPGREAEECFPAALRFHAEGGGEIGPEPAEPVAADMRPGGDGRRGALLKLLAGMIGTGLDELIRRDAQRRTAQLTVIASLAVAATLVMGALTTVAVGERNEARAQQAQAEGLIEFMLVDLRKRLEPVGRLDTLDAVGQKAMAYYVAEKGRALDADSLGRRARVLHLMGHLRESRGDLTGALELFRQASQSTEALLARAPNDPQRVYDHAQSVYWVGEIAQERGDLEQAAAQFESYKRLADRLTDLAPGREDWGEEPADASYDLGVVLLAEHRADRAADAFASALAVFQARALEAPGDRDRQWELAQAHAQLSDTELARGRLEAAMDQRMRERSIYQAMLAVNPGDNGVIYSGAGNHIAAGRLMLAQHRTAAALAELKQAESALDRMMAADPDVVVYREGASTTLALMGEALLDQHDLASAAADAALARAFAEGLVRKDPGMLTWQGKILGAAKVLQIEVATAGASSKAARRAALAPAAPEAARLAKLIDGQPHDRDLARLAAQASLLAGDFRSLGGEARAASAAWTDCLQILSRAQADGVDPLDDASRMLMVEAQSRLKSPMFTTLRRSAEPGV